MPNPSPGHVQRVFYGALFVLFSLTYVLVNPDAYAPPEGHTEDVSASLPVHFTTP